MVTDNLRSAFNVGGVFRTVDAAGGEMVHLAGYTARPPHPRVLRAAMGADRFVAWKAWPDARHGVEWLLERGFHVVGLEPTAQAVDYRHYDYRFPLGVVVGNEALGISPVVTRRLHGTVRIPMHGWKGSLNVVVALGVVLFHVVERAIRSLSAPESTAGDGAILEAILARVVSAAPQGVWRWMTESRGVTLILLVHAPQFPPANIWAHADEGGVLLMCRQTIAECGAGDACGWQSLLENARCPAETPPAEPPQRYPRALPFEVAVRLARAAASGGKARLGIDHVLFELLHRRDLATEVVEPELTRFLDAEGPEQMHAAAMRCTDALLRPLGGAWHPNELLYDPEGVGKDPTVDEAIRHILEPANPAGK